MTAHACNEPLRCPECVRRFWLWAQSHTRGRAGPQVQGRGLRPQTVSFYEAAAKFIDVDHRARR